MKRLFVAYFEDEEGILGATTEARKAGIQIHDVYTPYAVHGMDEAMGLRPSRLGLVCFGAGALGVGGAWLLQYWTSAVDWTLIVGGKPFHSLPAFVPIMFELMVLSAALITVAALFLRTRLLPGRNGSPQLPRVTNDRFALALQTSEHPGTESVARDVCARFGAVEITFVEASA